MSMLVGNEKLPCHRPRRHFRRARFPGNAAIFTVQSVTYLRRHPLRFQRDPHGTAEPEVSPRPCKASPGAQLRRARRF